MLQIEPILLPNGRDTACQSDTGRQVGARSCCERSDCSSCDGVHLLTFCLLLPSLVVDDLKIVSAERPHVALRYAATLPMVVSDLLLTVL